MTRIARRRRIQCRMACEVLGQGKRPIRASVVSLSEGGFAVEVPLRVEQGEALRVRIRGARRLQIEGIVWNDRPARRARGGDRLRLLGCVLSDPPADFLALIEAVERRNGAPRPAPSARAARPLPRETDLPRSREPLPPPKPEPKETLPRFRVRLKQVGGPRTCLLKVGAHSVAEAQQRALAGLAGPSPGAWEVLEVRKETGRR